MEIDPLTKETLVDWSEINFETNVVARENYLSHTLWLNSLVRIDRHPVFL